MVQMVVMVLLDNEQKNYGDGIALAFTTVAV